MTDCIFCKIIKKEIPSTPLYEDADTYAFLDIRPVNPGHALVVPKKHSRNLYEIDSLSLNAMMQIVQKLAIAIKKATGADGINIGMNNDSAAGQVIFHTHAHVIPRFESDGYKHWGHKAYKEGQVEEIAAKIRQTLHS